MDDGFKISEDNKLLRELEEEITRLLDLNCFAFGFCQPL